MPTYQMLWDCPACGTTKLLGLDHRFCPSCGAPQDPSSRYFPSDADKIAVEDHVYAGADRACPHCGTANAAKAAYCVACGGPLEGAAEVDRRAEQAAGVEDSAAAARAEDRRRDQAEEASRSPTAARPVAGVGCGWGAARLTVVAVVGAILLCCGGLWAFTRTERVAVTVVGHAWERTIEVEALRTIQEEGWDDQVPSDAFGTACASRQRGSDQIPDGEDCWPVRVDHGDGTYSEQQRCTPRYRSVSTYDDWCVWTVDRWRTDRTERADGGLTDAPAWPPVHLGPDEREGERDERYVVELSAEDGDIGSCALPADRWRALEVGSAWTADRTVLTGAFDCGSLQPR